MNNAEQRKHNGGSSGRKLACGVEVDTGSAGSSTCRSPLETAGLHFSCCNHELLAARSRITGARHSRHESRAAPLQATGTAVRSGNPRQ